MDVRADGFLIAEKVRATCERPPPGVDPWKGRQIHALLERCWLVTREHELFHLTFLEGLRDLLEDEDEDAVLVRFTQQAMRSEGRVLADSVTTRDHLTHVTQVFLLGWLMLNGCRRFSSLGAEWRPYDWAREDRFRKLNRAWLYTALLHDCAYSVEYANLSANHEQRVRALFGPAYVLGSPGRVDPAASTLAGKKLWERRRRTIDVEINARVRTVCEAIQNRPDHAFHAAHALFGEAQHQGEDLRELLEVAATSLLCHNFRHTIDPSSKPHPDVVRWFSLDFWQEPLAGLLMLCDELQEWGRERVDLVMSRIDERGGQPYVRTTLTHLHIDDADGLTVDVRLARSLLPEDRWNTRRFVAELEQSIAKTNSTYRNGFKPRQTARGDLRLHLRVKESIDDQACRIDRTYDWPTSASGVLRRRHSEAVAREQTRATTTVQEVAVTWPEAMGGAQALLASDRSTTLTVDRLPERGLRLALVAPGGAGKSTLLLGLAGCAKIHDLATGGTDVTPLYVEELGDDLTDLLEECTRARADDGAHVLLVLDHLDRLVGSPVETFWTDRIRALRDQDWIHLVVACRPEEFETVVGHALSDVFGSDSYARIANPHGLLVEGADHAGRASAQTLRKHLTGEPDALRALGEIAVAMGNRRFLARRMPDIAAGVQFDGEPVLLFDGGNIRFVHDAVQDSLSARLLAERLDEHHDTPPAAAAALKALFDLPRDVPRLLFEEVELSERRDRERARRIESGLARGLVHGGALRHWMYEAGRLFPAAAALERLDARCADEELGAQTGALLALHHYSTLNLAEAHDSTVLTRARECGERFTTALHRLQARWTGADGQRALCVALGNHLLTILTRLDGRGSGTEAAVLRTYALGQLDAAGADAEAPSPAWFRRHLVAFEPGEIRCATLMAFDRDVSEIVAASRGERLNGLAVRRCQIAGHISGTLLIERELDAAGFDEAVRWQHRAIARIARVLRASASPVDDGVEYYHSRSMALAESAWRTSSVVLLWARAWRHNWHPDARYRLLEAHSAQQAAWNAAARALLPGERFSLVHRQGVGVRALGDALAAGGGARDLDRALERHWRDHLRLAERHPRFASVPIQWVGGFVEQFLGDVHDFATMFSTNERR
jgi:hypothetical protein